MKFEELVNTYFPGARISGDEATVRCVFHNDHNPSLQINLESGLYYCFSCGASGGPKSLGLALGVNVEGLDDDMGYLIKQLRKLEKSPYARAGASLSTYIYTDNYLDRYKFHTEEYKRRDIGLLAQRTFELGYDPLENFLSIPVRNVDNELVAVIKRYLDPASEIKYKYPSKFKKSDYLYGANLIAKSSNVRSVVLVEGSLDTAKVWQAGFLAGGILGSSLSAHQIRLLLQMDVEEVILFFDNDKAGRKATSQALGFKEKRIKVNGRRSTKTVYVPELDVRKYFAVKRVLYPHPSYIGVDGKRASDPGAMTNEQIESRLLNAVPVT